MLHYHYVFFSKGEKKKDIFIMLEYSFVSVKNPSRGEPSYAC